MKAVILGKYDRHGCSPGIADVSVPDIKQNEVFNLEDVNLALKKVYGGGSRGKTILKI